MNNALVPGANVRPFVDYYVAHDISPVHQDVRDVGKHLERRAALYRSLGIAPNSVTGRRVLEFGPGSGHNALYTASLRPAQYTLVDANPRGIDETRATLASAAASGVDITVVASLVEEFVSEADFDLVLAENLVPFQRDPGDFAQVIGRFAAPYALLVLTCIDGVSHLAEIGRRLLAHRVAPPALPLMVRLERLRPVFAAHVATLGAMSRSLDDWILDNLTHPLIGKTFSIPAALHALGSDFDVYGASPHFIVDWRWYKELVGDARQFNARAAEMYYANIMNFLDCRVCREPHDPKLGQHIAQRCELAYLAMQAVEAGLADEGAAIAEFQAIAALVRPLAAGTADSINALVDLLGRPAAASQSCPQVESFFGRGTQYLSFLRRASTWG